MEIFDFHTHIYPEKIAAAAVENVGKFYLVPEMACDGRVDTLLNIGKEAGITKFLVCSVATSPKHVTAINSFITQETQKQEAFYGFGTIHPDMENPEEVIQSIMDSGLKGIKIHPETQNFNLDDPKLFALCDMFRGKLPLLIHCGDYRYDNSHPTRLVNLLHNFPDLEVIAAHFGGWSIPDLASEYLDQESCYMDCSSSLFTLGKRRMKELIRHYGAHRILFGSDYPMWNPKTELEHLMSLNLTDDEYEMILQNNAKRILKLQ
jgi:predicted TIM-barrel fold metal-dependent hydrolase